MRVYLLCVGLVVENGKTYLVYHRTWGPVCLIAMVLWFFATAAFKGCHAEPSPQSGLTLATAAR